MRISIVNKGIITGHSPKKSSFPNFTSPKPSTAYGRLDVVKIIVGGIIDFSYFLLFKSIKCCFYVIDDVLYT